MTRIKICGITDAAAMDAAVAAGVDYVGFVFFEASPRFLTPVEARLLAERARGVKLVGLFVNPGFDEVELALREVSLDVLQVHCAPALVAPMRDRFGRPVWRQVGVASEADFPGSDEFADGFVVEAKPPPGATRPGGNAVRADWGLLAKFRPAKPWFLAGGLRAENVAEAIRVTGTPGVDVSSGVETAPGQKSPELIRKFVMAARGDRPR